MDSGKFLLDTHSLLWSEDNVKSLSGNAFEIISDPNHDIYFSQISLFEVAIKQAVGKLPDLKVNIEELYNQAIKADFKFLPLENRHILSYSQVPLYQNHKDPFDRILVAQAISENLPIITIDPKFKSYSDLVKVIW